jgi:hypothetical protein
MHSSIPLRSKSGFRPLARSASPPPVARSAARAVATKPPAKPARGIPAGKPEPKLLFQRFFQSVGPRTYTAQIKELPNGNQALVVTEEKRDPKTDELRQSRIFIYGEDFAAFFRMLHETAGFIRANPLSPEVRRRRNEFWAKKKK